MHPGTQPGKVRDVTDEVLPDANQSVHNKAATSSAFDFGLSSAAATGIKIIPNWIAARRSVGCDLLRRRIVIIDNLYYPL